MAEYQTVYQGNGVAIDAWRCRGKGSEEEAGAVNPAHSFAFPLRGAFRKHLGSDAGVATPGTAVYFRRGEEYRTSHPVADGDGGLVLRIDDDLLERVLDEIDLPDPDPTVETILVPASALRLRELLATARRGSVPRLDLEEATLNLLGDMLEAGHPVDDRTGRSATDRAHRRAVVRVLELCAERFRESLSLEEIAREAAYSPFHLARVFKRGTGVTIHRHLNRLRLTAALDRASSLGDLTRLALELGFSSHSHFTTAFRREFGAPPSRVLPSLRSSASR